MDTAFTDKQKYIFHLEAFVAKVMRILESYVLFSFNHLQRAYINRHDMGMDF